MSLKGSSIHSRLLSLVDFHILHHVMFHVFALFTKWTLANIFIKFWFPSVINLYVVNAPSSKQT